MSIQSIFPQLTTASPLLQELKMCLPNGGGGRSAASVRGSQASRREKDDTNRNRIQMFHLIVAYRMCERGETARGDTLRRKGERGSGEREREM